MRSEPDRIRNVLATHERLGIGVVSVGTARTLLAEVDRLNRCVGDALFALEDPHGNLSDAYLPIVRAALADALHPEAEPPAMSDLDAPPVRLPDPPAWMVDEALAWGDQ